MTSFVIVIIPIPDSFVDLLEDNLLYLFLAILIAIAHFAIKWQAYTRALKAFVSDLTL